MDIVYSSFIVYVHTGFLMVILWLKCKHDVVSLLTQPSSPPEEPAPAPPPQTKDKDSNANKKPPSKGKAAAGSQQVDF